jgi:hypothetical protein
MKKLRLLALWSTLILWTLAGCWSSNEQANSNINNNTNNTWTVTTTESNPVVAYHNNIINLTTKCAESEDLVRTLYDTYNEDNTSFKIEDIQDAINRTINECSNDLQEIYNLWDWNWDSSLKIWATEFIEKTIKLYQKLGESLPYLEKWNVTEDEKKAYDSIIAEIQSIVEEWWEANKNLSSLQTQFAQRYSFELKNDDEENNEWTIDEEANGWTSNEEAVNEEENIPSEEISE